MKPLLVIKTGASFGALAERKGDFDEWVVRGLGMGSAVWVSVDVFSGEKLPEPDTVCGAVITGSHAMVTDRELWSEYAAGWLKAAVESGLPVLGICYGHQLLAHALSGRVDYHPAGREVGTVPLELTRACKEDLLFRGLPCFFYGHVTHSQSVIELPSSAVCLARNAHEPHHAFRVGANAWGVQFHPEFDEDICRHYIDEQAEALIEEKQHPQDLHEKVCSTPVSAALLRRFAELCLG